MMLSLACRGAQRFGPAAGSLLSASAAAPPSANPRPPPHLPPPTPNPVRSVSNSLRTPEDSAVSRYLATLAAAAASAVLWGGFAASQAEAAPDNRGNEKLPTIPRSEVAKHSSKEAGIWVTYLDGVYDVTEFVEMHPGGSKIMLAAGKSIAPYWAMYAVHKTEATKELLEEYRIGNLPPHEVEEEVSEADAYANEPQRHPALKVHTQTPFNAETPLHIIESQDVTPVEMHFKRHHLPVPLVEAEAYELQVSGDLEEMSFKLEDIKKLPKHTVKATIQCSGNRRTEMSASRREGLPPVRGLPWTSGAMSTAEWSGAKLRDVLLAAGLTEDMPNGPKHITFVGLDMDVTGERYEVSIPIEKAMSAYGDVLLAYEMNGEPLTRDHGYPLRAIVPGTTAARSVKWVYKIIASEDECDGFWQQNDYKAFTPGQDPNTVDWSTAPAMQEFPVNSIMTSPATGDKIPAKQKTFEVKGIAVAGGGRGIARVDVSSDGGKTWTAATLAPDNQPSGRAWAWRRFSATVEIPETACGQEMNIVCKATDVGYNTQPERMDAIYNFRGIIANAWQHVKVTIV